MDKLRKKLASVEKEQSQEKIIDPKAIKLIAIPDTISEA